MWGKNTLIMRILKKKVTMNDQELKNLTFIVTGCSSGIGEAFCKYAKLQESNTSKYKKN